MAEAVAENADRGPGTETGIATGKRGAAVTGPEVVTVSTGRGAETGRGTAITSQTDIAVTGTGNARGNTVVAIRPIR